jgi:hypothetical protein
MQERKKLIGDFKARLCVWRTDVFGSITIQLRILICLCPHRYNSGQEKHEDNMANFTFRFAQFFKSSAKVQLFSDY